MPTNRLSDRKCSICKFPLDNDLTTEEIRLKYQGKYYHPGCKALANDFTDNVPSALADILRRTKKRASELGLDFDLGDDLEAMRFLMDMWERQGGLCAKTGIAMRCDVDHEMSFHLKPSLDRRVNEGDYVKENVQLVTQWYQYMKSDLPEGQAEAMCQAVITTAKLKRKTATRKRTARIVASSSKATKPRANSRGKSATI